MALLLPNKEGRGNKAQRWITKASLQTRQRNIWASPFAQTADRYRPKEPNRTQRRLIPGETYNNQILRLYCPQNLGYDSHSQNAVRKRVCEESADCFRHTNSTSPTQFPVARGYFSILLTR